MKYILYKDATSGMPTTYVKTTDPLSFTAIRGNAYRFDTYDRADLWRHAVEPYFSIAEVDRCPETRNWEKANEQFERLRQQCIRQGETIEQQRGRIDELKVINAEKCKDVSDLNNAVRNRDRTIRELERSSDHWGPAYDPAEMDRAIKEAQLRGYQQALEYMKAATSKLPPVALPPDIWERDPDKIAPFLAESAIHYLRGLAGFDDWWKDVGTYTRGQIKREMANRMWGSLPPEPRQCERQNICPEGERHREIQEAQLRGYQQALEYMKAATSKLPPVKLEEAFVPVYVLAKKCVTMDGLLYLSSGSGYETGDKNIALRFNTAVEAQNYKIEHHRTSWKVRRIYL